MYYLRKRMLLRKSVILTKPYICTDCIELQLSSKCYVGPSVLKVTEFYQISNFLLWKDVCYILTLGFQPHEKCICAAFCWSIDLLAATIKLWQRKKLTLLFLLIWIYPFFFQVYVIQRLCSHCLNCLQPPSSDNSFLGWARHNLIPF